MKRSRDGLFLCLNIILALAALSTVVVFYAEPVSDGDIWFHLAYGRYFVQHHTLWLDHRIFSWLPGDGSWIYCAWIAQITFYLLVSAGGIGALYLLRYLFILASLLFMLTGYLKIKNRMNYLPVVLLVCLNGLLMAQAGPRIKADLFSFLCMNILTWAWFSFKAQDRKSLWILYSFPVLLLFWANAHGGFIFGLTFLALAFAGEVMNLALKAREGIGGEYVGHLCLAGMLSGLAILATPYGWSYPAELVTQQTINSAELHRHISHIMEFQPTFSPGASGLHYLDYMVVSGLIYAILTALHGKKRGMDWSTFFVNVFFMVLYTKYLRATLYWGIISVYSCFYLLKRLSQAPPELPFRAALKYLVPGAAAAALLFLCARAQFEAFSIPNIYAAPVAETRFVGRNFPGMRLGNDYATGSYLLWALWPGNRTFVDAREGPMGKMIFEYFEFESTKDTARKDLFLRKYPCDVWVLSYNTELPQYFMKSKDWRLAYYGPAACVFVSSRLNRPKGHVTCVTADNVGFLQSLPVSNLAFLAGDRKLAKDVITHVKPFPLSGKLRKISQDIKMDMGDRFLKGNFYGDAHEIYASALGDDPGSATVYYRLGNAERTDSATLQEAMRNYRKSLSIDPRFVRAWINLGNAYLYLRRPDDAMKNYEKALEIEPANELAKKNMAVAMNQKKILDIVAYLRKGLAARPNDIRLMNALLAAYVKVQDYDSALAVLKGLLVRQPGNPDISYNIACVYALTGREDESVSWLKQAVGKGFHNWDLMRRDPDLRKIRGNPVVIALLKNH